jgi:sugar/nucleoside kinase (ribokinase family)
LIANRIEAAILCPALPADADPGALAQAVQALGTRHVVTPIGARGCLVASAAGVLHWSAITDTIVQDVTGAGDALTAGLLHGVLAHDDASRAIPAAMPFAIACATTALESTVSGLASVDIAAIHDRASALADPVAWQGMNLL